MTTTHTFRDHFYEEDETFDFSATYSWDTYPGVAFDVFGWECEADEDTEWSGQYVRTGKLLATMVGDDRVFAIDQEDLKPITEYCPGCGQIRCTAYAH